jgi:hypothetical protein
MSGKMDIEEALAHLEAGKFSFRMIEAVKDHVQKRDNELAILSDLHVRAVHDLKLRDYAIWRLEREATKLNARIHALLKANALTERAAREIDPLVAKSAAFSRVALGHARKAFEQAVADFRTGKLQADATRAGAKLYETLKANAPADGALSFTAQDLEGLKKRVKSSLEKAGAYLSTIRTPAA